MTFSIWRVVVCLVLLGTAWAQSPTRYRLDAAGIEPPEAGQGSFSVHLQAIDASGQPTVPVTTNAYLSADIIQPAGMAISELTDDLQTIEFLNAGETPIDLNGWNLYAGSIRTSSDISFTAHRKIEGKAILGPGEAIIWTCRSNVVESFPLLVSKRAFRTRPGPGQIDSVELREPSGRLVDEVAGGSITSGSQHLWNGAYLGLSILGKSSLIRIGNDNSFSSHDWVLGDSRIGKPKTGLNVPWVGKRTPTIISPDRVTLTNGHWAGTVRVGTGDSRHAVLFADDRSGDRSQSEVLSIIQRLPLSVRLLEGTNVFAEQQAGLTAVLEVALPGGRFADEDVTVTLSMDAAGEFAVPNQVVIPAGLSSVSFAVTNLDDLEADGRAVVQVTASAPHFSSGSFTLYNDDNESAMLVLPRLVPTYENAGLNPQAGTVYLPGPARHAVEIRLTSSGRVQVPDSVTVPSGATSAQFPIWITDNQVVDNGAIPDSITAQTSNWKPAMLSVVVREDESTTATYDLPTDLFEGETKTGRITAANPRQVDVDVTMSSTSSRVIVPNSIRLPAGERVVEFPITGSDNHVKDCGLQAHLLIEFPSPGSSTYQAILLHDREISVDALGMTFPSSLYAGDPAPLIAWASDRCGSVQLTNLIGQLSIRPAPDGSEVSVSAPQIALTNGQFNGTITLKGEALSAQLELDAAGLHQTAEFDLLSGRIVPGIISDVAHWNGHSSLLLIETVTNAVTNQSVLVELDPATGTFLRRLPLSTPASRLAVSDDGSVAWIAADADLLLQINLNSWSQDRSVSISTNTGVWHAVDLAIGPGSTESVAALVFPVDPNSMLPKHLVGWVDGLHATDGPKVDMGGFGANIIPGYSPGEFYITVSKVIQRIAFDQNRLSIVATRDLLSAPLAYLFHPVLLTDRLLVGNGSAFDPVNLTDMPGFDPSGYPGKSLALPMPDLGVVEFVYASQEVILHDLTSRAQIGRHQLPTFGSTENDSDRLVRWGSRGSALLSRSDRQLQLFESPLIAVGGADLELTADTPGTVPIHGVGPNPPAVAWHFTVTNHGPATARQVQFQLDLESPVSLGTLPPGQSVTITNSHSFYQIGLYTNGATVSSPARDPLPANNQITFRTSVTSSTPSGFGPASYLPLAARHLLKSPDSDTLYVTAGAESGSPGVAVIDPVRGSVVRTLAVGVEPQNLALNRDGQHLFVSLGDSRIVQWDFASDSVRLDFSVPSGGVTDLLVLPEARERLVVATYDGLLIYDGTNQVQGFPLRATPHRSVGIIGNDLWTVSPGLGIRFPLVPGNLARADSSVIGLPDNSFSFKAEGQRLFFRQVAFDRPSGRIVGIANGGFNIPAPPPWGYMIVGNQLQRFDYDDYYSQRGAPVAWDIVPGLDGFGPVAEAVRWGTNGVAILNSAGGLLIAASGVIPTGTSDVAVTFNPSPEAYYNEPYLASLTVTNLGPDPAPMTKLTLQGIDGTFGLPVYRNSQLLQLSLGTLPAGGSLTIPLEKTISQGGGSGYNFSVSVGSGANDPNPGNNSIYPYQLFDFDTNQILSFGLHIPPRAAVGDWVVVDCSITNIGSRPFYNLLPAFSKVDGLAPISTDLGSLDAQCCDDSMVHLPTTLLNPAESVSFHVTFQVLRPGVFPMTVRSGSPNYNPDLDQAFPAGFIFVPPPPGQSGEPHIDLSFDQIEWSAPRRQWMGWGSGSIVFLDADSLSQSDASPSAMLRITYQPPMTDVTCGLT